MARVAIDLGEATDAPAVPEALDDTTSEIADWIDFAEAGSEASGEFRCSDCGYGAVVLRVVPPCPMCRGTVWERRTPRFAR